VRGDASEIKRFRDGMGKDGDDLLEVYVPTPDLPDDNTDVLGPTGPTYRWRGENWGTPYDIVDVRAVANTSDRLLVLNFDSSWTPPIRGMIKIAALFPELDFHLKFDEPDCALRGFAHWAKGKLDYADKLKSYGINDEWWYTCVNDDDPVTGEEIGMDRAIVEQTIGRPLHSYEYVRHLNGDVLDNRESNTEVVEKARQLRYDTENDEICAKIDQIHKHTDEAIAMIRKKEDQLHNQIKWVKRHAAARIKELEPEIEIREGHSEIEHFDAGYRVFDCALCFEESCIYLVKLEDMWVFNHFVLAGSGRPVCDECAHQYAPELDDARDVGLEQIHKRALDAKTYDEFAGVGQSALNVRVGGGAA